MKFTPTQDFHDAELQSDYLTGLTYTVRQGNAVLAAKVSEWLEDGLVRVLDNSNPTAGIAQVSGVGHIQ